MRLKGHTNVVSAEQGKVIDVLPEESSAELENIKIEIKSSNTTGKNRRQTQVDNISFIKDKSIINKLESPKNVSEKVDVMNEFVTDWLITVYNDDYM